MTKEILITIFQLFPEGKLKRVFKRLYFAYINNHLYKVNNIIHKVEILKNELIRLDLINGFSLYDRKTTINKYDLAYEYAIKEKIKNIKNFYDYRQIYTRIYQEFILNQHLKKFDLQQGDIVVDAGANIGVFTINSGRIVGQNGIIIAIEPDRENLKVLKMNIQINNLKNVIILPFGLWSKKTLMNFFQSEFPGLHSLYDDIPGKKSDCSPNQQENLSKCKIKVNSLDNLVEELNMDKIDFIKMDIEGAELEALKGMEKVLSKKGIKLAIEANHVIDNKPTWKTIIPWLKKRGFKILDFDKKQQGIIYAIKN